MHILTLSPLQDILFHLQPRCDLSCNKIWMIDRVPDVWCPLPLDMSEPKEQVSEREESVHWKEKESDNASKNMMWPGSNMKLILWPCTVRNPAAVAVQISDEARAGSELRGWERARLKYSDAYCGAFINRVSYTHHPACIGYTVENGRLASNGRYRENSLDWDTHLTLRHRSTYTEISPDATTTSRFFQHIEQIF